MSVLALFLVVEKLPSLSHLLRPTEKMAELTSTYDLWVCGRKERQRSPLPVGALREFEMC